MCFQGHLGWRCCFGKEAGLQLSAGAWRTTAQRITMLTIVGAPVPVYARLGAMFVTASAANFSTIAACYRTTGRCSAALMAVSSAWVVRNWLRCADTANGLILARGGHGLAPHCNNFRRNAARPSMNLVLCGSNASSLCVVRQGALQFTTCLCCC
jgi:hypothetical protein